MTVTFVVVIMTINMISCRVLESTNIPGTSKFLTTTTTTKQDQPTFAIGARYWTSAYEDPLLGISHIVPIFNKPSDDFNDPTVTVLDFLQDATPLTLIGMQSDWCYVKALSLIGQSVEGWLRCKQLLEYQPTPLPTPNLTPQAP